MKCKRCGKEFEQSRKCHVVQKYCSNRCAVRECMARYNAKKRLLKPIQPIYTITCEICNNPFDTTYSNKKTCSIACSKTRRNRRSKSGGIVSGIKKVPCEFCGNTFLAIIQRHHLDISKGNSGGVICLCPNCHATYHYRMGSRIKSVATSKEEVLRVLE